jgi:hypothetical protein
LGIHFDRRNRDLGAKLLNVETSGILSFNNREESNIPWWWYLDINGTPLYLIGNHCGTCSSIFKRVADINLPLAPGQLSDVLAKGISSISEEIEETVLTLLPMGNYLAGIIEIEPVYITHERSGMNVSCNADYFWMKQISASPERIETEIILPVVSNESLDQDRITDYSELMKQGAHPTAMALSLVDSRCPAARMDEWILAHFLIDGHHKVMAASRLGLPISILSFLSISESNEDILENSYIQSHFGLT